MKINFLENKKTCSISYNSYEYSYWSMFFYKISVLISLPYDSEQNDSYTHWVDIRNGKKKLP